MNTRPAKRLATIAAVILIASGRDSGTKLDATKLTLELMYSAADVPSVNLEGQPEAAISQQAGQGEAGPQARVEWFRHEHPDIEPQRGGGRHEREQGECRGGRHHDEPSSVPS